MAGFLALWNSVADPGLVAEYEVWHALEHVPERVGLPGFLAAHRYVTQEGQVNGPAYFTLYELRTLDALLTPEYLDVLDRPTPWSARMRAVLTDFCREPCQQVRVHGPSRGGCLATVQLALASPQAALLLDENLRQWVAQGHAVRATMGLLENRSKHPLAAGVSVPQGEQVVVLLEHVRHAQVQHAVARLLEALPSGTVLRATPAYYQLQSTVERGALLHPLDMRQPPRPDLRQPFLSGAKA